MIDFLPAGRGMLGYLLVALVLVVVWWGAPRLLRRWRQRRPTRRDTAAREPTLDELAPAGPPAHGPQLLLRNIPVRLVMVVLAPVGRGSPVPSSAEIPQIVDQIVPGLQKVAAAHGAAIKLWPPQLSTQGFASAFFGDQPLPGNRGKGSPWSALTGRFSTGDRPMLAGIILRAAAPNNLGQITLEDETRWLDALRVTE